MERVGWLDSGTGDSIAYKNASSHEWPHSATYQSTLISPIERAGTTMARSLARWQSLVFLGAGALRPHDGFTLADQRIFQPLAMLGKELVGQFLRTEPAHLGDLVARSWLARVGRRMAEEGD